jgi:mRNA interferase HicA
VDEKRGKGSHVTLYFGDWLTVVRNPKDELKTGTLHAMCKQLDIRRDEL